MASPSLNRTYYLLVQVKKQFRICSVCRQVTEIVDLECSLAADPFPPDAALKAALSPFNMRPEL
jgi:hypothetical protein